jgi:phosphoribosyl-ATP pyrophosphohydrolase
MAGVLVTIEDPTLPALSLPRVAMSPTESIFAQLMAVIETRKATMPEKSYTTKLFAGGVPKIGEKIVEEAAEVVEAAAETGEEGRQHLIREAGDLLYHLFVMLGHRDVRLPEVEAELARRFGISGLDEKASRTTS